jgi:hypothetical protein
MCAYTYILLIWVWLNRFACGKTNLRCVEQADGKHGCLPQDQLEVVAVEQDEGSRKGLED